MSPPGKDVSSNEIVGNPDDFICHLLPGHLICLLRFYLFRRFYFFFSPALLPLPGGEMAQLFTLRTARALAMTAVDVVCSPALLKQVREDFKLARLTAEK